MIAPTRPGLLLVLLAVVACEDDSDMSDTPAGKSTGQGQMTSSPDGGMGSSADSLPDLVLDPDYLLDTTGLDTVTVDDMCLIAEGCVTGLGERRVVRFGSRTGNLGKGDFVLGAPRAGNPLWTHNACRDSYDLIGFARYALIDRATNEEVVSGAKNGFCIADADHYDETFGFCNVYNCDNQGITTGCADNYGSALECQWVDITGVPPGSYEMRVTINADRTVPETSYENNVVRVQLEIGESDLRIVR